MTDKEILRMVASCLDIDVKQGTVPGSASMSSIPRTFRLVIFLIPFFTALALSTGTSVLLAGVNMLGATDTRSLNDFHLMLESQTRAEILANARLEESVIEFGYFTVDTLFIDKYVVAPALAGETVSPVTLELFPKRTDVFTVSVEHVEEIPPHEGQGSIPLVHSWEGAIKEDSNGLAVFIVKEGTLYGTIWAKNRVYRIRPVGGTIHEVLEIDPNKLPDEMRPTKLPVDRRRSAFSGRHSIGPVMAPQPCIIDVMVLYTGALYGYGDQNFKLARMWYDATLSIKVANWILARSGIMHRLRLVHVAELSRVVVFLNGWTRREYYSENGKTFEDILQEFLNPVSGSIPEDAVAWRRDHHADLVSIRVNKPKDAYCGFAYPMDPPGQDFGPSAYSVVDYLCGWVRFSDLHEMGHNMGAAHHDRNSEGHVDAGGLLNYGHINWTTDPNIPREGTIMSERLASGCLDCRRLGYFSNPRNTAYFDGSRMGEAAGTPNAADNATWLNSTGAIVSSFEPPSYCRLPLRLDE